MLIRRISLLGLAAIALMLTAVPAQAQQSQPIEIAQRTIPALTLKIRAKCLENRAFFTLKNIGERWPDRAHLIVFKQDENNIVSHRQLKMARNQTVSFKAKADGIGNVGLLIDAPWEDEEFNFGQKLTCD